MTMPLQFDKPAYLKVLREAGIPPDIAEAHTEAIEQGLDQPIVLPADLALLKAELLARIDEKVNEAMAELLAEICEKLDQAKAELLAAIGEKVDQAKAMILRRVNLLFAIALSMSAVSLVLGGATYMLLRQLVARL